LNRGEPGGSAAGVVVREAEPAEHEPAGRLTVDVYSAIPGTHMNDGYATELADVARRAREAVVLVGLVDGELAGCVTYVPDAASPWAEGLRPGEAGIRMLAVHPAARGRGLGTALVEACLGRARAAGRHAVFLYSTPWMKAAHRIYVKAGFTRAPERDWAPLPELPLVAFVLPLRPPSRLASAPGPAPR